MPDLLPALVADCPKRRSFSIYDRCKAVYERRGRSGTFRILLGTPLGVDLTRTRREGLRVKNPIACLRQ